MPIPVIVGAALRTEPFIPRVASSDITVVYVAYATTALDLAWLPASVPIVVVHNDRSLQPSSCDGTSVTHVMSPLNVGFGAAVNVALEHVKSERVIVCNPDTVLTGEHFAALASGTPDEILTLPLVDGRGSPTSVVNRYPTPTSLLLTGYRVGRFFRREGAVRQVLARALGRWGQAHRELLAAPSGTWPLSQYWVSGAVFSIDTERLTQAGGFDPEFFLYLEDVDLCHRMAERFPSMRIRMAATSPGIHRVGGSAPARSDRRRVNRHLLESARRYASRRRGLGWRMCRLGLAPRAMWLAAVA